MSEPSHPIERDCSMSDENTGKEKSRVSVSTKLVLVAIGASAVTAGVCFAIVALLPAPEGTGRFKDPLRSLLTGLGVLGIATPLCIAGHMLKKRSASSPYFEGAFIATVLGIFGFVCLAVGLACIILGGYDWITSLLEPRR